ncbi:RNA 3'-terminal phosphate cyclase [Physcia stellaris]|nr:RNA 3'-terminal phosphate cyclase [Physcia stellaris]
MSTTFLTMTSSAPIVPLSASKTPSGAGLKASFTQYGGCKTKTVACGFFGGFNAAVSQNLFGAAPGDGPGPACHSCYSLSSSTAGTKSIVVKVNNLCPAIGNEAMCAQNGMSGTNSVGANVNFDLCEDDGSSAAFFGSSGLGMTTGVATPVACP